MLSVCSARPLVALAPLAAQAPATAQTAATAKPAPAAKGKPWAVPRTPDGKPDLQGNWSNETQTPLERMGKQGATLTHDEAAAIEERAQAVAEFRDKASDPNRPTPVKGGDQRVLTAPGEPSFIERIAEAAGGKVGGYNGFWLDPGDKVITIDGVPRSSIIVDPPDGRVPAMTAEAKQRMARTRGARRRSSASSITRRFGRSPIAACCRSARTPARRCCRTTSTTTTTRSCRRRIT